VEDGSGSDNANIVQYTCDDDAWRQSWELVDLGNGYLQIKNRNSGKCMRASDGSLVQYTCDDSYWTEMFTREEAGSSYYLLKNRDAGTCLRVENSASADGTNIVLDDCDADYWSQQFAFSSLKSTQAIPGNLASEITDVLEIWPTLVGSYLNITLGNGHEKGTTINIYSSTGKLILRQKLTGESNTLNVEALPSGIYLLKTSAFGVQKTKKFMKK
jgi:hypothetical protein